MDRELRLPDLVLSRDWWALVIVLCVIWAIEWHKGNGVIETIAAPLLVVGWGGVVFLLDRWALRHVDRQNGGIDGVDGRARAG
jgi:hypothetical protein